MTRYPGAAVPLAIILAAFPDLLRADSVVDDAAGLVQQARTVGAQITARHGAQNAAANAAIADGGCDPRKWFAQDPDPDSPLAPVEVASRLSKRTFPSVFQAWSPAQNLNETPFKGVVPLSDDKAANLARHDLAWLTPQAMGLKPNAACEGLSTGYTPESVAQAQQLRSQILAKNPDAILLAAIHYFDASGNYLPPGHDWWKKDASGQREPNSSASHPDQFFLDYSNPDLQKQVALKCKAAIQSGVFDGCMLDFWGRPEDPPRIAMLEAIRKAIGNEPFLLVNSGDKIPVEAAPYINGIFMEGFNGFWSSWDKAQEIFAWAKSRGIVAAFEANAFSSRNDVKMMRAATAMALLWDGYVLFGDRNHHLDKTPDHLHDWYPFWDKDLGKPRGNFSMGSENGLPNNSMVREFDNGTVVFNPPSNRLITVNFPEPRTSRATHKRGTSHLIEPGDGDIFLK